MIDYSKMEDFNPFFCRIHQILVYKEQNNFLPFLNYYFSKAALC